MILSILICTMPERKLMFLRLVENLNGQIASLNSDLIEIISCDKLNMSVGLKRNNLLQKSSGKFIVYIDDDDEVTDDYVSLIYNTIKNNPDIDCIGIKGYITENGGEPKDWVISMDYPDWFEENNIFYRTPNHISPVKRDIALLSGFPDTRFSEDYDYAMGILPHLKKEAKIDKQIYHYKFQSK